MSQSSSSTSPHVSPLEPIFARYSGTIPLAFREQFFHSAEYPYGLVLQGVIHHLWYRPRWLAPLFRLLERIGILISQQGRDIPTTLEVRPGYDREGQPYHIWARTFNFNRRRFFNTTIIYAPDLGHVVDLVGPKDVLYMVWRAQFHPPGTFTLHTAACAIRLGRGRIWLPRWLWQWLLGTVRFRQRVDPSREDTVHIGLVIRHPQLGDIFGYTGTFTATRVPKPNSALYSESEALCVEQIGIPGESLIADVFSHADYADAYRVQLPAGAPRDIDALTYSALGAAPRWIHALMALRDRIVRVVGLKTTPPNQGNLARTPLQPGAALGIFRVIARSADEILLGENDRHLDFRVSVLRQSDGAADWVIVSTVVRFNNWLGRAYFLPVRPLHRLIVPAMLRSALRRQAHRSTRLGT